MNGNKLDKIEWTREKSGFEVVLGKYVIQEILELARGPRVLDVGCGDGLLTKELVRHFKHVVGVDGSKEKIELARKNAPEARFYASLFEDFKPEQKFDSILMIEVLEHFDDPVTVLGKAKGMLNKDGCIIVLVPNALSLNRRIGKIMGLIKDCYELTPNDIKNGHKRFYDKKMLKKDVEKSGLKADKIGGIFLKPLSNKQMESWDKKVCGAFYEIGKELPDYSAMIYIRAFTK